MTLTILLLIATAACALTSARRFELARQSKWFWVGVFVGLVLLRAAGPDLGETGGFLEFGVLLGFALHVFPALRRSAGRAPKPSLVKEREYQSAMERDARIANLVREAWRGELSRPADGVPTSMPPGAPRRYLKS